MWEAVEKGKDGKREKEGECDERDELMYFISCRFARAGACAKRMPRLVYQRPHEHRDGRLLMSIDSEQGDRTEGIPRQITVMREVGYPAARMPF